jgi:type VI secretion system protein ImpJ
VTDAGVKRPAHRHERLTEVFPPLFALVEVLLEASLPSRVVAIDLERDDRRKRWHARLHDPRLREEADFYLSVRSALPSAQLLEQFPAQCRTGCPDEVDRIVNGSERGVPLKAMTHVPAAIPLRLENQYFTLDMTHPAAQAMLAEGHCVFYVPGRLGEPELELYAVLRS